MDVIGALFSSIISISIFVLFAAGVLKLFQIHATLGEIKDVLQGIRAHASVPASLPHTSAPFVAAPAPMSPSLDTRSGEEMLRALDAQMHLEEASAARHPENVEPR